MSGQDSTQPLEVSVEIDGEPWVLVLDYRAYAAIEERTGVDLTSTEGEQAWDDGSVELRRAFYHEGFKSGLYHRTKRELIEAGKDVTAARAEAMERANQLSADVVMAELRPEVLAEMDAQMDELLAAQAEEQEELIEGEEAGDPLATSASGGPGGS